MLTKPTLTREEIDELARAFGDKAEKVRKPAAKVRAYNFGKPDKLSKANVRALQLVFSSLERPWSNELSSSMKNRSVVEINPVHQASFGAYAGSSPSPGLIFEVAMDSLPGPMLIDMPVSLAAGMVDCMAGGDGRVESISSGLTRIQTEIIKRFAARLVECMEKAWSPITAVHLSMDAVHGSPDELDISSDEPMLVVGTLWRFDDTVGRVNIAMPVASLDGIIDLLDPQRWLKGGSAPHQASTEPISKLLKSVNMGVSVDLGRAQVSVRDVLNMEAGDVIKLDAGVNDPLQVKVGGRVRFQARPGLVGKKVSAQIVDGAGAGLESADIAEQS